MAITIDYSDGVTPEYIINIPRLDMLDVTGGSPTEIRQLNVDDFRKVLADLGDDPDGMNFPTSFFHTPPLTVAGVTLARVVQILDPYVIQFEDGLYNVNIVGGNSNVSDVTIKNQVGVNTANSAGLQDPFALQAGAFGGEVAISSTSGITGTTFPKGTRGFPVDNLTDAVTIANTRGIHIIRVIGDFTVATTDFSQGFIFRGDTPETTSITINANSNVTNCEFQNAQVQGTLDGDNLLTDCQLLSVDMFDGTIRKCGLGGDITLSGTGSVAEIVNCYSNIAGGGPGAYPDIDMGGAGGTDLLVRGYDGGLGIKNCSAVVVASLDFSSGRVTFDADVTAGAFVVRGVADVVDNSTSPAVVTDLTINATVIKTRKHQTNKLVTDPITGIATLYDDDGVTVLETAPLFEDAGGTQTYRGTGAERREGYTP